MLPKAFLAPIFDYTNAPFRLLCQRHGAESTAVPLVNVSAIIHGVNLVDAVTGEKNLGVQLSGAKPNEFIETVRIIEKKFPFIKRFDINAGCPSSNTMQNGGGAALMRKSDILMSIVKAMKKETSLPVSVKMRIFRDKEKTLDLASRIESAGADFVTVHGRTAKQGYSGTADWEMIRSIKESLSIPIIGNGDVKCRKDGISRIKDGFCDSFMIGRAAMSNPLVFKDKTELTYEQRKKLFLEYADLCSKHDMIELNDLRRKSVQLFRSVRNGAKMRGMLMQSETAEELISKVE